MADIGDLVNVNLRQELNDARHDLKVVTEQRDRLRKHLIAIQVFIDKMMDPAKE